MESANKRLMADIVGLLRDYDSASDLYERLSKLKAGDNTVISKARSFKRNWNDSTKELLNDFRQEQARICLLTLGMFDELVDGKVVNDSKMPS